MPKVSSFPHVTPTEATKIPTVDEKHITCGDISELCNPVCASQRTAVVAVAWGDDGGTINTFNWSSGADSWGTDTNSDLKITRTGSNAQFPVAGMYQVNVRVETLLESPSKLALTLQRTGLPSPFSTAVLQSVTGVSGIYQDLTVTKIVPITDTSVQFLTAYLTCDKNGGTVSASSYVTVETAITLLNPF
jgi:hypothetical protein